MFGLCGKCHVLMYHSLDGKALSWYASFPPFWYQKVSLCLLNSGLACRADVNLTPEPFKGGRSLVGMFVSPLSGLPRARNIGENELRHIQEER